MMNTIPYWDELPDLDLYLDQILLYVNQYTQYSLDPKDKGLTASMINNYVKHKHIDKPIKKKYQKHQLARLIALNSLKHVFSIQEISHTLNLLSEKQDSKTLYNHFVDCMRNQENNETPEIIRCACRALKLYYKTRQLTLDLEGERS